jgi:hypothetical protein
MVSSRGAWPSACSLSRAVNSKYLLPLVLAAGCAGQTDSVGSSGELEAPFTSDVATLLELEFDGELVSSSAVNLKNQVRAQLLYTVGHFNAEPGVSRLDKMKASNLTAVAIGGGLYRIRYHVILPVAWGSKTDLPTSYTLTLPRRVDATGQAAFTAKYGQSCNDGEGDAVNVSNFWYHYRPHADGCTLADADVFAVTSPAKVSPDNTTVAKYPEYQKVWEDNALRVVAVFGKYAKGATSNDDAGIASFNAFIASIRAELPDAQTTPANLPVDPGVAAPDVTFEVRRADGNSISVVAILVDEVASVGPAFDTRYNQVTTGADLIIYNGHAGLGANVRALSAKGKWFPGKYQMFFLDGCDTFAYVDNALSDARARLNANDPNGTKYMDVITNAMPAYFMYMPQASMALIRALLHPEAPVSYGRIFQDVDVSQVVVVTGEEDNVYTPSYDPGAIWNGMNVVGEVSYKQSVQYETEVLRPGKYAFTMTPDAAISGGDGDLRVRVGAVPTLTATYKCPSYIYNSNEKCVITVATPSKVYLTATGDSVTAVAKYQIDAWQLP